MCEIDRARFWKIQQQEEKIYMINSDGERYPYVFDNEVSHGDVISIRDNGNIYKLHDGKSSSALIFVTNQCNSNCVMCPDSVRMRTRENTVSYEELKDYINLLPSDLMHMDITGASCIIQI